MKALIILLITLNSLAIAQWQAKQGSSVEVTLEFSGVGQQSRLVLKTDPPVNKEILLRLESNSGLSSVSLIRPALAKGEHVFEYDFAETGGWWGWMRYGVGVDTYQTSIRFTLPEQAESKFFSKRFRGDLEENVPDYVQPVGFAILGLILLFSCVIVISAVRWVAKQQSIT